MKTKNLQNSAVRALDIPGHIAVRPNLLFLLCPLQQFHEVLGGEVRAHQPGALSLGISEARVGLIDRLNCRDENRAKLTNRGPVRLL